MTILDGQALSQKILAQIKSQIASISPSLCLDIILVGDNPASLKYTTQKQKIGQRIGLDVNIHRLPTNTNTVTVLNLVHRLNREEKSTGLIVQLPLPPQLNTNSILNAIVPAKDVDGLSATNLGMLFQNHSRAIAAATPLGIIKLLQQYNVPFAGKNAVIINRSPVVGLPLLALLKNNHATVTLCHSQTQNLSQICRQADILISATNQPSLITPDYVKNGAVVVDVGYPSADVDFKSVAPKTSFITPVFIKKMTETRAKTEVPDIKQETEATQSGLSGDTLVKDIKTMSLKDYWKGYKEHRQKQVKEKLANRQAQTKAEEAETNVFGLGKLSDK